MDDGSIPIILGWCVRIYIHLGNIHDLIRGANPPAQLRVVTITKRCIFSIKVSQKSKILSKPLPKRVKWAKMCEKKSNGSPKRVKITPK